LGKLRKDILNFLDVDKSSLSDAEPGRLNLLECSYTESKEKKQCYDYLLDRLVPAVSLVALNLPHHVHSLDHLGREEARYSRNKGSENAVDTERFYQALGLLFNNGNISRQRVFANSSRHEPIGFGIFGPDKLIIPQYEF
jgi:hypothetical protein